MATTIMTKKTLDQIELTRTELEQVTGGFKAFANGLFDLRRHASVTSGSESSSYNHSRHKDFDSTLRVNPSSLDDVIGDWLRSFFNAR